MQKLTQNLSMAKSIRNKTIKQKKIGEKLFDFGLGNTFLNMTAKPEKY